MTAAELTRHIEKATGKLFLTESQIAKLGFGKDAVHRLCKGLDYVTLGEKRKCRQYYIGDISKAILNQRILHD